MADSDIIEDFAEAVVRPPDGGWGWVIVVASFFCNCIVDGMIFTVGQAFQPEWERYYNVNSGTAAWATSLLSGGYLLTGPLVSALANIWGCRRVVLAGTFVAVTGFLISMAAPTVTVLYFTFGVMGGIGFGLIYMPSIVIVSYYFEKRRAFATGLAVCGSGIGTFIFAPLINYLLSEFPWQSALLIMSGITLHCLIFGSLYQMPEPSKEQLEHLKTLYEEDAELVRSSTSIDGLDPPNHPVRRRRAQTVDSVMNGSWMPTSRATEESSERLASSPRPSTADRGYFHDVSGKWTKYSLFSIPEASTGERGLMRGVSVESIRRLNRPLSRPDIFFQGSIRHLPEYRAANEDVGRYIASTTNLDTVVEQEEALGEGGLSGFRDSVMATLRGLLNPEIIRSPSFIVLTLSGFFTLTGFFVPFIYLPRYAEHQGISKDKSTLLVQLLGITNIVGRVFCGWLSDQPRMNALMINNIALTIGGLATIVVPHLKAFWMLCIYCIFFGFGTACFAALRSVICVDLLGLQRLNNVFGLTLLFLGFAALIGSPIAGALYDATGNYNMSFYVTGSLVMLSGIILFPLKRINQWERRHMEGGIEDDEEGIDELDGEEGRQEVELVEVIAEGSEENESEANEGVTDDNVI